MTKEERVRMQKILDDMTLEIDEAVASESRKGLYKKPVRTYHRGPAIEKNERHRYSNLDDSVDVIR